MEAPGGRTVQNRCQNNARRFNVSPLNRTYREIAAKLGFLSQLRICRPPPLISDHPHLGNIQTRDVVWTSWGVFTRVEYRCWSRRFGFFHDVILSHGMKSEDHTDILDIIDDLNINNSKYINSSGKETICWILEEKYSVQRLVKCDLSIIFISAHRYAD